MNTTRLSASATVTLTAAPAGSKKRPTFEVNAYNGDAIRPYSPMLDAPLVIDLAGVNVPSDNLSALLDHRPSAIVGQTTSVSIGDAINMAGIITGDTDTPGTPAHEVVTHARNGYIWPASIDGEIQRMEFIEAGEQVQVNSRTFQGPVYVARATILDGFSFVSTGADRSARAKVAARTGANMADFNAWLETRGFEADSLTDKQRESLQASYNAELKASAGNDPLGGTRRQRQRVGKLQAVLDDWSDRHPSHSGIIEACGKVALAENWTPEALELRLWQECAPVADNTLRSSGAGRVNRDVLTAGIMCRLGNESLAAKCFGDQTVSAARKFRHTMDIVEAGLRLDGVEVPDNRHDVFRVAFSGPSTFSLPTALSDAGSRIMLEAWKNTPNVWSAISKRASLPDFRTAKVFRPVLRQAPREVPAGGNLQHASASEDQYSNLRLGTYGQVFGIDRRDVIGDDLSALAEIQQAMGPNAMRGLSDLWAKTLLGADIWDATNSYADAAAALSIPALEIAVRLMRKQTDLDGRNLDLVPVTLLVGPTLETAARKLLNSTELQRYVADGTDSQPTGNPFANMSLNLAVEPRLENTNFAGASDSTWYVFAGSYAAPMIVAFLQGRESPVVEYFGLDHDPDTLSVKFRAYHDYGCATGDPKAAVKMALE